MLLALFHYYASVLLSKKIYALVSKTIMLSSITSFTYMKFINYSKKILKSHINDDFKLIDGVIKN